MDPIERLFDLGGGDRLPLPDELLRLYGGPLAMPTGALYANFVQSIDGIVAIRSVPSPSALISGGATSDHFVMAILRAAADAVLIGAGTLRDAPGHRWTPAGIDAGRAALYAELRERLGLTAEPKLVVLTASGSLDPSHPGFGPGAVVLTTETGARRLAGSLSPTCELVVLAGEDGLDVGEALDVLRRGGMGRILTEAGPMVTRQLLARSLLDELYVTQSPVLVGSDHHESRALSGEAGVPPLAAGGLERPATLISAGRHGSYLFLRYRLTGESQD
ncbi:MAG: dihydrofolate reductase family protein [Actinomycetota bacterium]